MSYCLFLILILFPVIYGCGSLSQVKRQTTTSEIPVAPFPTQIVSVDLNRDGRPDIAVISKTPVVRVFFNNGGGSFDNFKEFQTYPHNTSLCAADFDGDGATDIAILTETRVGPFFLGDGKGGFTVFQSTLPAPGLGRYIMATDLNNDGLADLIAVGTGYISLYINKGNLSFEIISFAMGEMFYSKHISSADLDGNGFEDIIFSDYPSGRLYIIWNEGNGVFGSPLPVYEAKGDTISAAVPLRRPESAVPGIVLSLEHSATIVLLGSTGNRTYAETSRISVAPQPSSLISADMNNDGIEDIIVLHLPLPGQKGKASILYGPSLLSGFNLDFSGIPFFSTVVDWDRDGYLDLFIPNYDLGMITYIPSPGRN